jgi:hypothetical protein
VRFTAAKPDVLPALGISRQSSLLSQGKQFAVHAETVASAAPCP